MKVQINISCWILVFRTYNKKTCFNFDVLSFSKNKKIALMLQRCFLIACSKY